MEKSQANMLLRDPAEVSHWLAALRSVGELSDRLKDDDRSEEGLSMVVYRVLNELETALVVYPRFVPGGKWSLHWDRK